MCKHPIRFTLTNAIYVFLRIVVMHRAAGSACGSNWITRATVYGCTMIIMTNTAVTLFCYYSLPSQTVVQAAHSPLPARYCIYNFGRAQIHVNACTYTHIYVRCTVLFTQLLQCFFENGGVHVKQGRCPWKRPINIPNAIVQACIWRKSSLYARIQARTFTFCTSRHIWFDALNMMRMVVRFLCHKVWHGFSGILVNFTVSFISMTTEKHLYFRTERISGYLVQYISALREKTVETRDVRFYARPIMVLAAVSIILIRGYNRKTIGPEDSADGSSRQNVDDAVILSRKNGECASHSDVSHALCPLPRPLVFSSLLFFYQSNKINNNGDTG